MKNKKRYVNKQKMVNETEEKVSLKNGKNCISVTEIEKPIKIVVQDDRKISLSNAINVIMAVLSFLSFLGVVFTLHEMKVQRNATYNPSIVFNPIEVSFEWDENGIETWIKKEDLEAESSTEINEDGSISGTISLPIIHLINSYTKYSVVNIGVGTAKNIVFKWDEGNTQKLYEYLLACNPQKEGFCMIGENSDSFEIQDAVILTNKEDKVQLMYMLPEASESYEIYLPPQYTLLINEAIKSGGMRGEDNPYLVLQVSYQDVQGFTKNDLMIILIKRTYFEENEDGSGKASYQLIQALPSEVVD